MTLPRVVILGGGVGSVTTAAQLSKPGWQQHFASITLYQQGWRLGGKGASGRGVHQRIEEHGLHIWFGFYENAFGLLRACHDELDALAAAGTERWPLTFTSVQDSFAPCTEITLTDHDGCCWKPWVADFFVFDDDRPWAMPDPRTPGERPQDWSVLFYAARCLHLAADLSCSLVRSDPGATFVAGPVMSADAASGTPEAMARALWDALGSGPRQALSLAAETLDAAVALTVAVPGVLELLEVLLSVVDVALEGLRRRCDQLVRGSDTARRAWYVVDLMLAIARGVVKDGLVTADDFTVIDDMEFRDWLRAHGADQESVDCALVRGVVYDLAFAYAGGDPNRPAAAAGTALRGLLRTFFTYRGALMFKMNAGMGDVVFAPHYELLSKRGVDVRFFHRVEAIRAKNGTVEELEIDVQAEIPAATVPRDYLVDPTKAAIPSVYPKAVWPAAPLVPAGTGKTAAGKTKPAPPASAYESWFAERSATQMSTVILKHGAPNDGFEIVVSGLPIATVPHVAPDLVAQSARWKAAVGAVKTVPTQAMQLWLDRSSLQLGAGKAGTVVGGYVEPYDTWSDMPQLVSQEDVPGAKTVAYFCNVLLDDPKPPARGKASAGWLAQQLALVRAQAVRFLTHDVAYLWPQGVNPLTGEMDWERLIAGAGIKGVARLDEQYLRANVEPSERYVLSVPGSGAHRIAPGDTGFANLYVAGDWTACHLDAGCVEAATMSGMLAANAIHQAVGDPANIDTIIGVDGP